MSNFSIPHIQALIDATGVTPIVNQVEAHPYLPQTELAAFGKKHNIHITAYSSFGNNDLGVPLLIHHDEVVSVAKKLSAEKGEEVTPAQVLVGWVVSKGFSIVPKSVKKERIESNFKQVELSADDVAAIDKIGAGKTTR